jgi:hypothetical protein
MDTDKEEGQGCAWTIQTGAAFSNPSTSELARDCKTHLSSAERMALLRFARGAINFEPRMTRMDTDKAEVRGTQGCAWTIQTGVAFSNTSTSELARDCENTSLIRRADGPAALRTGIFGRKYGVVLGLPSRDVLLKSIRKLTCKCLFHNTSSIRAANHPRAFCSSHPCISW